MTDSLKFDVSLKEIPVTLTKDGTETEHILREFNGDQRKKYFESILTVVKMGIDDGNIQAVSLKSQSNLAGIQSSLIAMCLFTKLENTPVAEETILKYPTTVINSLYTECQKLNGLGADAETIAKNESKGKSEDG